MHRIQLALSPLGGLPGCAAYHSSVLVDGTEFSFSDSGIGVFQGTASHSSAPAPPQLVDMGTSARSGQELQGTLGRHFQPGTYDLLRKNCNAFSDCALSFLVGKRLDASYRTLERLGVGQVGLLQTLSGGQYSPNPHASDFDLERLVAELSCQSVPRNWDSVGHVTGGTVVATSAEALRQARLARFATPSAVSTEVVGSMDPPCALSTHVNATIGEAPMSGAYVGVRSNASWAAHVASAAQPTISPSAARSGAVDVVVEECTASSAESVGAVGVAESVGRTDGSVMSTEGSGQPRSAVRRFRCLPWPRVLRRKEPDHSQETQDQQQECSHCQPAADQCLHVDDETSVRVDDSEDAASRNCQPAADQHIQTVEETSVRIASESNSEAPQVSADERYAWQLLNEYDEQFARQLANEDQMRDGRYLGDSSGSPPVAAVRPMDASAAGAANAVDRSSGNLRHARHLPQQTSLDNGVANAASRVVAELLGVLNETAVAVDQNLSSVSATVERDLTSAFGRPLAPELSSASAGLERDLRSVLSHLGFFGAAGANRTSIDERTLDAHTVRAVHRGHGSEGTNVEGTAQCTVCLGTFEAGDEIRILPCLHQYHQACIDTHLLRHGATCPVCRHNVLQTS